MNPKKLFEEVSCAIAHRCVSTTNHWHIVYYHDRICCVPTNENVPPEIILGKFTEQMAQAKPTLPWWNELETNFTKLYEELHR